MVARRTVLGVGAAAVAAGALVRPAAAAAGNDPAARVAAVYNREVARAGGTWNAFISVVDPVGGLNKAVVVRPDDVIEAYSVNKIPVAVAVLDKVDRGLLRLDQRVDVTADIIIPAVDGIFALDRAYPSSITLGHAMAALLTVSDDTAVRLCGLVAPAREINDILVAKGFPHTQVEPVANPNRFFLGQTTPREMHDLLRALVAGTLLSPASTAYLLNVIRSLSAFTDGIRLNLSSNERLQVATKAGWFGDTRNEAGIMFAANGSPILTYALFAHGAGQPDNFGATHPLVRARAGMGKDFLDIASGVNGPATPAYVAPRYQPTNGG